MTPKKAHPAIPATGYTHRFCMPELLGVSIPTIDRWMNNGTMPRPVKLSDSVSAFDAVEINNWLSALVRWHNAEEKPPRTAGG